MREADADSDVLTAIVAGVFPPHVISPSIAPPRESQRRSTASTPTTASTICVWPSLPRQALFRKPTCITS